MRKSILAIAATCAIMVSGISIAADYDYNVVGNHTFKNNTFNDVNSDGLILGNSGNCAGQCHDGKSPGGIDNIDTVIGKSFNYDVNYAYLRTVPVWTAIACTETKYTDPVFGLSKVPVAI